MSALKQENMIAKDRIVPAIGTFVLLTALLGGLVSLVVIEMGTKRLYMALMMWTPGIAAFATLFLFGKGPSSLGWTFRLKGPVAWSYLLPVLYGGIAYFIIWTGGYGGFGNEKFYQELAYLTGASNWSETQLVVVGFLLVGTVGILWHIMTALGEEIGWRGFLVAQLFRKVSFFWTSVLSGLVWALWHYPIILYAGYNAGPIGLGNQLVNFTVMCIALSFPMAYFRLTSGSVWPATVLHAAHNLFILSLFHPATIKYDDTWYFAGEFGIILPGVLVVVAVVFWYRARSIGYTGPIH